MSTFFSRRKISILSVDWDYFFPNVDDYDWTHNEEGSLYFEMIWSLRPGNARLGDPSKVAVETVRPDRKLLDGFWGRTVKMMPWGLIVAESHADLYRVVIESIQPARVEITNFDAHHDAGYGMKMEPNCGNWAERFHKGKKLDRYELVYPPWRKDDPEGKLPRFAKVIDPPPARRYDFIFICRSGCWTPTWADREWLEFIGWWKREKYVWNHKTAAPYALKERSPNLEEANRISRQMREDFEKLTRQTTERLEKEAKLQKVGKES